MGLMDQASLVNDLKSMLKEAVKKFSNDDSDYIRLIDFALSDISRVRPYRKTGAITLIAEVGEYPLPADLYKLDFPLWGNAERRTRKPWNTNYPGPAPVAHVFGGGASKMLYLSPAPTSAQIINLGDQYKFYYRGLHVVNAAAENTTVDSADRDLLLIRATAQAMNEMAADGVTKPIKLGGSGVGAMPKNGTPAALAESLMNLFTSMSA